MRSAGCIKPEKSGSDVISVDAMGGDHGPKVIVSGVARAAKAHPNVRFVVHGDGGVLKKLIGWRRVLRGRCEIRHAEKVVTMASKPSQAMRSGEGTSMWSAIEALRNGEARAAVSCGNTGALMAISMMKLRKAPGIKRPAIACLWPSRNPSGFNVLLDVGADIKADLHDLLGYAAMGAGYSRSGLGVRRPRVGLLNVGTEAHKGRPEIKAAHELIGKESTNCDFDYVGFVEGSDIPSDRADVFVTDGFTGNLVLKSVEGTASLIREFTKEAFRHTPLSRIGALFALTSLRRLTMRIDPRRVNGGVFLGLNGTVVKSHGSADAVGVGAAVGLAVRLARTGGAENFGLEDVFFHPKLARQHDARPAAE